MNLLIETQEEVFAELQSSNEENVSANEEFQTLNEELETSKEEIEASNEELITANCELQKRNDLLSEFQEYSEAITSTIHEPMLVMYTDFKVKSANKSFYDKFRLKREDTEGKNLFELDKGQWNIAQLKKALNEILAKNSDFKDLELKQILSNNE
jgi:two-component system CheB/CheR fusion protein